MSFCTSEASEFLPVGSVVMETINFLQTWYTSSVHIFFVHYISLLVLIFHDGQKLNYKNVTFRKNNTELKHTTSLSTFLESSSFPKPSMIKELKSLSAIGPEDVWTVNPDGKVAAM